LLLPSRTVKRVVVFYLSLTKKVKVKKYRTKSMNYADYYLLSGCRPSLPHQKQQKPVKKMMSQELQTVLAIVKTQVEVLQQKAEHVDDYNFDVLSQAEVKTIIQYEIHGFQTIDEVAHYCELMSRVPMKIARLK